MTMAAVPKYCFCVWKPHTYNRRKHSFHHLEYGWTHSMNKRPLDGIRVVEMVSLIAGPFAGKTLGDFGASVNKIEPPRNGDPLRSWRTQEGETSMWWHVQAR